MPFYIVLLTDVSCLTFSMCYSILYNVIILRFNLPTEKLNQTLANLPDSYKKHKVKYEFKKHGRMIQVNKYNYILLLIICLRLMGINLPCTILRTVK
jgi:hypothetical protein